MQRFTKVRDNGKAVILKYTTDEANGVHHHEVVRKERPHADFVAALDAFKPFVAQLIDVNEAYLADARIASVTVSSKGGVRGCTIHAVRPVTRSKAPLNIHTPHIKEEVLSTDDEAEGEQEETPDDAVGIWLPGMDEALETLESEAVHYLNGKNEQGDLFNQPVEAHRRPGIQSHTEPLVGAH